MILGIDASRANLNQRTGTEAYAYFLIAALVPQALARGHHVRLYFNEPPLRATHPSLYPTEAEASVFRQVVMPTPRLWTHLRLAKELHQRPPHIFFTPAHVIPYSYRGASVATIHDLGYHYFPRAHTRRQRSYLRWSTRHNARRARHVIADSQATKDDITRFYGTNPQKISVVYPALDPALQRAEDDAILRQYGIRKPYFFYIGTIQPRKNLSRLVGAFERVSAEIPHQLVLAGKPGWLSKKLLRTIEALPTAIRKRVLLTGYVPEAHKAALFSSATALVFPSLHEGFGFPALEAQRCQIPVLTSSTSSLPEAVGAGALLVDPTRTQQIADGMRRLAQDGTLRQQLVAAGNEHVQEFEWMVSAETVLNILENAAITP